MATRETKYAWANYYDAAETIRQMTEDNKLYLEFLWKTYGEENKECGYEDDAPALIAKVLWKFAGTHGLRQEHFSEYMDGVKTYKGVGKKWVRDENDNKKEVEVPFHFTQSGKPYKEWKDGDEPCFYMKSYPITKEYFKLDGRLGAFVLNDKVRKGMRKGTLAAYRKKIGELVEEKTE